MFFPRMKCSSEGVICRLLTLVQEKSLDYSTNSSKKSFETLLPAVAKTQNLLPNIRRNLF